MAKTLSTKYRAEFILEFRSVDRFAYRASDLYTIKDYLPPDVLERLDNCHIYLICKRHRLTIVPDSVRFDSEWIQCAVQYTVASRTFQSEIALPRPDPGADAVSYECSAYPHREIVAKDPNGRTLGYILLANFAHVMPSVVREAQDLEVLYIGKGTSHSAQDRLESHSTLQRILAEINSEDPDAEVFVLVYSFEYKKHAMAFTDSEPIVSGAAARSVMTRAAEYRPSKEQQIALIEAATISWFKTAKYNTHYIDFPKKEHAILKDIYEADFAAIVVQLDNTNIGNLRTFSDAVPASSTHDIVVDFRAIEGLLSFFKLSHVRR